MAKKDAYDEVLQWRFPAASALVGFVIAVAAAALALGPDTWMDGLMAGTTLISTHAAKLTLGLASLAIMVGLMVPLVKQSLR